MSILRYEQPPPRRHQSAPAPPDAAWLSFLLIVGGSLLAWLGCLLLESPFGWGAVAVPLLSQVLMFWFVVRPMALHLYRHQSSAALVLLLVALGYHVVASLLSWLINWHI